ncbi:hypothetical protein PTKIN_Ptkin13bG0266500 [Pterospermum kingtungense]
MVERQSVPRSRISIFFSVNWNCRGGKDVYTNVVLLPFGTEEVPNSLHSLSLDIDCISCKFRNLLSWCCDLNPFMGMMLHLKTNEQRFYGTLSLILKLRPVIFSACIEVDDIIEICRELFLCKFIASLKT